MRQQVFWMEEWATDDSTGIAKAPEGKVVIAGGYDVANIPSPQVLRSTISDDGDGWQVFLTKHGDIHGITSWYVWAICAKKA